MRRLVILAAGLALVVALVASSRDAPIEPGVEQWPEADALFHQDPRWLGSDGGISIDLGGDRSVWLFPDTFVAISDKNVREESCLVRNTVGVMEGSNPETASMAFHWRTAPDGLPESFFAEGRDVCFQGDDAWYWPGDGERLGESGPLLVFLTLVHPDPAGLGFSEDGWAAVLVENPDDEAETWRVRHLTPRANRWGIRLGVPGVFVDGQWLYAFGVSDVSEAHLARWPVEQAAAGDLHGLEWWAGSEAGFVPEADLDVLPAVLFGEALPESAYEARNGYVALQTVGFGAASLGVRTAPSFTGLWSPLRELWRPPESSRAGVYVYGFKAHPELEAGRAVAITYATNAAEFADVVRDASIAYPRFARLRVGS